eukprot:TRINITY_DN796_c0_g1_i17.p1 TRINITY_DN796_c0_g1~~TRINITY_DN796_c0_g1_i17.p1  ORF type:complete len:110 (-),score=19.96 TRINITY_DN796_c0_g1_i17:860-1189(-)
MRTGALRLNRGDVAPLCLVVGDAERARLVADLEPGILVSSNREYYTYTGKHKGKRVTVSSHGVGGGGASVCFEELITVACFFSLFLPFNPKFSRQEPRLSYVQEPADLS